MKKEARKYYLDILKVISIFCVMYVHTGNDGMHIYETTEGLSHYVSFFLREYAHTCSYMFFMITGALLLKKEEDLKTVLLKRVLKYGVIILLAETARLIYYNVASGTKLSFKGWFSAIYSTNVLEQYWFLHAYLAFLIMLPFLRMIAKGLSKQTALYLLVLLTIFEFGCSYFEILMDLSRISISVPLLTDIIILPLLGYCAEYVLSDWLEKFSVRVVVYVAAILAFAADLLYTHKMYLAGNIIPEMNGSYFIMTIGLYVLGRKLFMNVGKKHRLDEKKVRILSSATLCVLLLEPELREFTHIVYEISAPYLGWLVAVLLWLAAAYFMAVVINLLYRIFTEAILKTIGQKKKHEKA